MLEWLLKRRSPDSTRRTVERDDYRVERLAFLRTVIDPSASHGLEIGAFDLPTVLPDQGLCEFADWRSTDELARVFGVARTSVAPVRYVVARDVPLSDQITSRFDYVLACHVLEHVPDPIAFIADLACLVRVGGIIALAVPDKRHTPDASRPSTTVDQLLERHYLRMSSPSLSHIMEFSRTWSEELRRVETRSPREFYDYAVRQLESGIADAHCSVWRDEELFAQLDTLIASDFLPGLEVAARAHNSPPFNEFYVALRRRSATASVASCTNHPGERES